MEYLNKAFGGSGDRPTDGSRESERSHQIDRSEGRYDEPRYDNSGRNDEGRHGQGGLREEGQSSGGFLGSLGDKFGGGPQKGHQTEQSRRNEEGGGGGFLSGISNKLNAAAGGGPESEKNEDLLDKGMFFSPVPSRSFCMMVNDRVGGRISVCRGRLCPAVYGWRRPE